MAEDYEKNTRRILEKYGDIYYLKGHRLGMYEVYEIYDIYDGVFNNGK